MRTAGQSDRRTAGLPDSLRGKGENLRCGGGRRAEIDTVRPSAGPPVRGSHRRWRHGRSPHACSCDCRRSSGACARNRAGVDRSDAGCRVQDPAHQGLSFSSASHRADLSPSVVEKRSLAVPCGPPSSSDRQCFRERAAGRSCGYWGLCLRSRRMVGRTPWGPHRYPRAERLSRVGITMAE
jgi:hypothetical protein